MKINGLIKKALYENIKCICHKSDIELKYPLIDCKSCKFQKCWESVPKQNFEANDDIRDKNGKVTKKQTKTVKEITLVRGSFEDVIGWLHG
tara:strand:+ start:142 stop:414 length:273 start_codon:yes stop_codon:yes gene_type:complete